MRVMAIAAILGASAVLAWLLGSSPHLSEFETTLRRMGSRIDEVESKAWPSHEARREAIGQIRLEGLSTIDFGALTTEQIDQLTRKRYFGSMGFEPDFSGQVIEELDLRAAESSPAGAYAASVRALILSRDPAKLEAAATASLQVLRHPSAPSLLQDARGEAIFSHANRALTLATDADGPPPAIAAIQSLMDQIPSEFDPSNLSGADSLYESLALHEQPDVRAFAEEVRLRLITLGRARLSQGDLSRDKRWWPELRLAFLEHGPARINLLNGSAPEIEFAWWSDEAEPIRRLSDLQGDIVVLDVWSSDCGFSLPALRARTEFTPRYEDKGVRFVALTEHASRFWTSSEEEKAVATPKIRDTARAAKAYRESNSLTSIFAIVDDKSHAFAASYGVRGVPTTIVIDHHGVVRGLDHDPRDPERTALLLDQLLAERRAP